MADFAGTKTKISCKPPFGGHPGVLIFNIALAATTYANGNLNLSGIPLPAGITPDMIKYVNIGVGNSAAGYMPLFTQAATPTWANLGTLKLFSATGVEATGSLTLTMTVMAVLCTQDIV